MRSTSSIKQSIRKIAVMAAVWTLWMTAAYGDFHGGSGTAADPYQIATPEHLIYIGSNTDLLNKHYILVNDIVFEPDTNPAHVFTAAVVAPDTSSDSYFQGVAFTGVFDGHGYAVRNLVIDGAENDYVGLFGTVENTSEVKNLRVENANIHGKDFVGILAGYYEGNIRSCYSSGAAQGNLGVGGLTGRNYNSRIVNSGSSASVKGEVACGGLAGHGNVSSFVSCWAVGDVTGSRCGGLVGGCLNGSVILDCYARGNVTAGQGSAGGDSQGSAGGLVGYTGGIGSANLAIVNSYAAGHVTGTGEVGGLVGMTLPMSGSGLIVNCFWDMQTTGMTQGVGAGKWDVVATCGKTTAQMQEATTYRQAGWQFAEPECGLMGWHVPQNAYPEFHFQNADAVTVPRVRGLAPQQAQSLLAGAGFTVETVETAASLSMPAGLVMGLSAVEGGFATAATPLTLYVSSGPGQADGSEAAPWPIASQADLEYLGAHPERYGDSFRLTRDIYIDEESVYNAALIAPEGQPRFTGRFDGAGCRIGNLALDGSQYLGLFGTTEGAELINLKIVNARLYGSYSGVVCGWAIKSTLRNCHVTGSLPGAWVIVGGLCGQISSSSTVENCSSVINALSATSSRAGTVGGLVGENSHGTISNCRAAGTVVITAEGKSIGGLCGRNHYGGTIRHSTSEVIVASFGQRTGGLVGYQGEWGSLTSTISHCSAAGEVIGRIQVGGLCGLNERGIIEYCRATGSVQGAESVGGLCGSNSGGLLQHCVAEGDVSNSGKISSADYTGLGGLCGFNGGAAEFCSASGDVFASSPYPDSALSYIGGLNGEGGGAFGCRASGNVVCEGKFQYVGGLFGSGSNVERCVAVGSVTCSGYGFYAGGLCGRVGTIKQSVATGSVTVGAGSKWVGGFGGQVGSSINNCYALGDVSAENATYVGGFAGLGAGITNCYSAGRIAAAGSTDVGGFAGTLLGPVTSCFWDTEASGQAASAAGTGLTTAQMQTHPPFKAAGWDFVDDDTDGPHNLWRMCVDGVGYPRLSWEQAQAGDFACPDGTDMDDLAALAMHWLTVEVGNHRFNHAADADGDGRINLVDLQTLSDHWRE